MHGAELLGFGAQPEATTASGSQHESKKKVDRFALLPYDPTGPLKALWPPRRGYFGLCNGRNDFATINGNDSKCPPCYGAANICKSISVVACLPLILELSPKKTPCSLLNTQKNDSKKSARGPFRKAPRFNSAVKSSSRKGS